MESETMIRDNEAVAATKTMLVPPQIVTNSWMLMMRYRPEDPSELRKILPSELTPHPDGNVYIALYTVPNGDLTNGFGAYTLTYMGIELDGHDGYVRNSPDGFPGRFFSHYFCNSETVRGFVESQFGLRTEHGVTHVENVGDQVRAKLVVNGKALVSASAKVNMDNMGSAGGHFHYFSQDRGGEIYNTDAARGRFGPVRRQIIPYVADVAETTEAQLNFDGAADHPVKRLSPSEVVWAAWLRGSFAYTEANEI